MYVHAGRANLGFLCAVALHYFVELHSMQTGQNQQAHMEQAAVILCCLLALSLGLCQGWGEGIFGWSATLQRTNHGLECRPAHLMHALLVLICLCPAGQPV